MDTKKIIDENWNQYQGINGASIDGAIETVTDCINGIRCFVGWRKEDFLVTIWKSCGNIVLGTFETTANATLRIFVQVPVQLEDIGCTDGNVLIAFVDGIQHIPVAHDFFLVAVPGCGFLHTELLDSSVCGDDSLNLVGCLSTLYLCYID